MIDGEQVYVPDFHSGAGQVELAGAEFHHLVRVRRFQEGDEIWLVNGAGLAARCELTNIEQESVQLAVREEVPERGELPGRVILAIANLKGDHLNLVVEKATELGVAEIIPLLTDHTIKKGLNQTRLRRIALAAMKQSRRSRLPEIHELTPLQQAMAGNHADKQLFCYAGDDSRSLLSVLPKDQPPGTLTIWIGPEGDWSQDEIDLASVSDYTFTGLGPRRLRAETAAIHAAGLVAASLQDPA